MNRYVPPGVNLYEKDKRDKRLRRHRRLKKLRRLLGLPEKNMFIRPGVYTQERNWSYVTKNN